jgi:hypothetical protein
MQIKEKKIARETMYYKRFGQFSDTNLKRLLMYGVHNSSDDSDV